MTKTNVTSSDVRQWARNKGIEVGERGRLSPEVLAAYAAAHGGAGVKPAAKKASAKKSAAKKAPAKKAAAKKAPAKKAPVKKAPAKKAPAKRAVAKKAPVRQVAAPVVTSAPVAKPTFRQAEPVTAPPAATLDAGRVAALEEQIAKLTSRLERIESAKAVAPKRGLFSRK